jgi:hypothetical protein
MDKECVRQVKQWLREARRLMNAGHKDDAADDGDRDTGNDDLNPQYESFSEVKPMPINWLWPNVVPSDCLTLVEGDPAAGKSMFLLDLAARVSAGLPMPCGSPTRKGSVLICNKEDNAHQTLTPRPIAAGADRGNVFRMRTTLLFPQHLTWLYKTIRKEGIALVIIDPITNYLEPHINADKDQSIRQVLGPLADIAAETGTAILLVRHLKKNLEGTTDITQGLGSIGFSGAARYSLKITRKKKSDLREIKIGKNNLTADPNGVLQYRIVSAPVILDNGTEKDAAKVQWLKTTPEEAPKEERVEQAPTATTEDLLCEYLQQHPEGVTQAQIGTALGWIQSKVSRVLDTVKGRIRKDGSQKTGRYFLKDAAVIS